MPEARIPGEATIPAVSPGRGRAQRQRSIADLVRARGFVSVEELVGELGVSRMTIHRDLDELVGRQEIQRVRGGASAERSATFESDFSAREIECRAEKLAIARTAATLINEGDALILGDSSTVALIAEHMAAFDQLTVITNSAPVLDAVANADGVHLVCLGGDFDRRHRAFLGLLCEQALTSLHADTLFVSSSALMGGSVMHQDERIVRVKQAMMRAAATKVLLLDHTKIGAGAVHKVASTVDFDYVIVDDRTDPGHVAELRDLGVTVLVAPVTDE
ncbi:MAG: DeoR/GlpR family DNA-binding transcription regulator [Beutenbergiaceae bacterium]